MPVAANPLKRDYFVYTFHVDGYPFYVGIGRDRRASDRLRYVRSLTPEKLKKKSLSVRVMAALDGRACIEYSCTKMPLNRTQALALEKMTIEEFIREGYLLTNWQHNPFRHNDTDKAVRAIRRKMLTDRTCAA
ncbi:hypothetical protein J2R76_002501 [Bradyrhizobium sp. USDA 4532]|uniref:hypothetical protein n=1 Tax=unclassified Bradyrhizobium TaxID=2631580 RepID=UPI00209D9CB3|nr:MULTISPECIES: hypothetical protein [unclassified Bradyrhizobium]MCP1834164.1 hypothetical protein [Bradyrhizobium sp. USDA 4545]MCP1918910.1 hypothetical protein [Bradyrhizobium sp. USDA 4532]